MPSVQLESCVYVVLSNAVIADLDQRPSDQSPGLGLAWGLQAPAIGCIYIEKSDFGARVHKLTSDIGFSGIKLRQVDDVKVTSDHGVRGFEQVCEVGMLNSTL